MKIKHVILLLIPLLFVACDKEEKTAVDKHAPSAIEQKIINFKATLTSNAKEDITYTLEEAEWNLEALLNYEEANNEHNFYNLKFVKDTYEVPVTNGSISNNDLLAAYHHFLEKIMAATEDETVFSNLVDLTIVTSGSKDDGEANIEMNYNYGSNVAIINYNPFAVNEDWIWGWDQGPCGLNPSTEMTDAAERLQKKFNNPITVGLPGFYTNTRLVDTDGSYWDSDPNNPADSVRSTIIYWDGTCTADMCIGYEELNFYLSKFDYIKSQLIPSNKDFASVKVTEDILLGKGKDDDPKGAYLHRYEITYGNFNPNSSGSTE